MSASPSIAIRKLWLPAAVLAIAFLLPGLAMAFGSDELWKSLMFTALIGINPALSLVAGGIIGYRHGWAWLFLALVFIAWLPATFLIYNSSALVYGAVYVVFALLGITLGWALRTYARRPVAPKA